MEKNKDHRLRFPFLVGLLLAIMLVFIFCLYNSQIRHGDEYRARSIASNATRENVEASRGILTDRNGKVLVTNQQIYTLRFSREGFSDNESLNAAIWRLISLCKKNRVSWTDTLPISTSTPYCYINAYKTDDFAAFIKDNKLSASASAADVLAALQKLWGLDNSSYTPLQARLIAGVRYELRSHSTYVFAEDVSVEVLSQIADGHFAGVTSGVSSKRVYNTSYASHILGRITRIYAENWEAYAQQGYSMDALVGESGAEKAFESYLRGIDGTRLVTTDSSGRISGELYTRQPQPGGTVSLTIDIDLQAACEEALANTVKGMIDKDSNERGAAAVVMSVGNGEVLALASYPTYDLSDISNSYSALLADERLPMFNRATDGIYAPGSTFKPVTAVAALESGIITPSTEITDNGIYTFYSSPQPQCWLWRSSHTTHGRINVSQAITVSCNYFFYETGRLTGIAKIDDYARQFGLGESTGIEIGDSSGALASPEYAKSHQLEWSDGQTLTAAIGQSYNLFTPLQLSNYVATLAGGGEHYAAHLLKSVKSYDNSQLLYVYDEEPTNVVEMSQATTNAVLSGMHDLTTSSLAYVFKDCVVSAGAKTGSAQVGTDIANGVFVAFAPYEDPQIAVAVVIEKGGSGSALASTAVEIINAYFATQTFASAQGETALIR